MPSCKRQRAYETRFPVRDTLNNPGQRGTLAAGGSLVDSGRSKRPAVLGIRGFHPPSALFQSALPDVTLRSDAPQGAGTMDIDDGSHQLRALDRTA
jgi:hypothetical protein